MLRLFKIFIFLAFLFLFTLIGYTQNPSHEIQLTDSEKAWVKEHPVITVHNEKNWPPFNFNENGQPQGVSIDYMNILADKLGVKVKYVTGPSWNEFLEMLKNRELDVMLNIVRTPDRLKYVLFTDPYLQNSNTIVSHKDSPIYTVQDLYGKKVAIPKGFFYEEIIRKNHPEIKLVLLEDILAGLKAVSLGEADATLGEQAVVYHLIRRNMLSNLNVSGEARLGDPDIDNLRIGVRQDWPLLQSAIKKAMATVSHQEMSNIQEKWLLDSVPENDSPEEGGLFDNNVLIVKCLAAFFTLLLVLMFLYWIAKGRPKQFNIKLTILLVEGVFGALIVINSVLLLVLLHGEKRLNELETRKYDSLRLALELKQSSDDLTKFARTFAVTGDPRYEEYFQSIIRIRDGKQPHPRGFNQIYWDQVAAGVIDPNEDGEVYNIKQRMQDIGMSEMEMEKLSQAKSESDDLINMEDTAINAVKGLYKDDAGEFTVKGKPNLEMSVSLLYGEKYHAAKARIMMLINDFYVLMEKRVDSELRVARAQNQSVLFAMTGMILLTIVFFNLRLSAFPKKDGKAS